jgi:hypothetical protein
MEGQMSVISALMNMATIEGLARQLLAIGQTLKIIPADLSALEIINMAVDAMAGLIPEKGPLSQLPLTIKGVTKVVENLQKPVDVKLEAYGNVVSEVKMSKINLIATLKTYASSYLKSFLVLHTVKARSEQNPTAFYPVFDGGDDKIMALIGLVDLTYLKQGIIEGNPQALTMVSQMPIFQESSEKLLNLLAKLRSAEDLGVIVQDLTLFPKDSLKDIPKTDLIEGFVGKAEKLSGLEAIGRNLSENLLGNKPSAAEKDGSVGFEFDFDFSELAKSFTEYV